MFVDSAPSTGDIFAQIVSRSGNITVLNTDSHTGDRPSVVQSIAMMSFIDAGIDGAAVDAVCANPGGIKGVNG